MELRKLFADYEEMHAAEHSVLQRILLSLLRENIRTAEELEQLFLLQRQRLERTRGIGPVSMELIARVIQFYRQKS